VRGHEGAHGHAQPADAPPAPPAPSAPLTPRVPPVFSVQSREDTDAAWGEYPESADDQLYRDRPPHWDNS
jgi:hypothetical protein